MKLACLIPKKLLHLCYIHISHILNDARVYACIFYDKVDKIPHKSDQAWRLSWLCVFLDYYSGLPIVLIEMQ